MGECAHVRIGLYIRAHDTRGMCHRWRTHQRALGVLRGAEDILDALDSNPGAVNCVDAHVDVPIRSVANFPAERHRGV